MINSSQQTSNNESLIMTTIYEIGTQYMPNGKHAKLCTIVEILKTYNSKNELVDIRYHSTHDFLGQTVTNYDVIAVTIARGIFRLTEKS